ncbi:DUF2239 family protein [uncultured Microbulbifer sp.]|uniref:DUF2239 family protein n=1 Tax=uncultured Microbulbifer sp. TaxID=348147 RepID=UPI0025E8E383|nr:DUF2239 family protein [uncultured Microbulbifer sp.]
MSELNPSHPQHCIAFLGSGCLARGPAQQVVATLLEKVAKADLPQVLIFDSEDSQLIELDLRLSPQQLLARFTSAEVSPAIEAEEAEEAPKRRGRPKLGVVSKEVTLLPRHWEWLQTQPGGASVALRRLVEQARKAGAEQDRVRRRQASCYRFMQAMAGDRPNFEEATRTLYAREGALFEREIASWPQDIRSHAAELAAEVFGHGQG